jgi:hypothetical protein
LEAKLVSNPGRPCYNIAVAGCKSAAGNAEMPIYAKREQTIKNLTADSVQSNKLNFDRKDMNVANIAGANEFIKPRYREGWKI